MTFSKYHLLFPKDLTSRRYYSNTNPPKAFLPPHTSNQHHTMPSQRQAIHASSAPKPNGNYSHVVREGNTLHIGNQSKTNIPILTPISYSRSFCVYRELRNADLMWGKSWLDGWWSNYWWYRPGRYRSTNGSFDISFIHSSIHPLLLYLPSLIHHLLLFNLLPILTSPTPKHRAILNIKACLLAANSSLDKIVRRRIYLLKMSDFRKVDEIWAEYFEEPYPVSTCVQVSGLAKEGALVELEVVAQAWR